MTCGPFVSWFALSRLRGITAAQFGDDPRCSNRWVNLVWRAAMAATLATSNSVHCGPPVAEVAAQDGAQPVRGTESWRRAIMVDTLQRLAAGVVPGVADAISNVHRAEALAARAPLGVLGAMEYDWHPTTRILIVTASTLDVCRELSRDRRELRIAALSFANPSSVGGGYVSGGTSQEAQMFRRTNLVSFLVDHPAGCPTSRDSAHAACLTAVMLPAAALPPAGPYGLPDRGCIYSRGVTVFRAAESANCALLPVPFRVDIISAAAQRLPAARRVARFTPVERGEAEARMRGVLRAARAEGAQTLVLGAWGLFEFGNDPRSVADAWYRVLAADDYADARCFHAILFAIPPTGNAASSCPVTGAFDDAHHFTLFGGAGGSRGDACVLDHVHAYIQVLPSLAGAPAPPPPVVFAVDD